MNLLVVGVSHHTAPVTLLERLSVSPAQGADVLAQIAASPNVHEAVLLSTCNRVEIYADVRAFHGGLAEIAAVLGQRAGVSPADLAPYLYLHYDADAVKHAFRVSAGLDSMVVGEAQILGQLRDAYGQAVERETAGRLLHELMQQALRVGKRVHAETGIDRAGQSIVSAALAIADAKNPIRDATALVVGAGSMGALALATLSRTTAGTGATRLLVTNRSADRAVRLAQLHGAATVSYADFPAALAEVDLVVCATASPATVLTKEKVAAALPARGGRPLTILDLAVPRDVEPTVADLAGVHLIDVTAIGESVATAGGAVVTDRAAAEEIVATEVEAFLTWLRGADVAPTVAALRSQADDVVATELSRLATRRPDLTDEQRADVAHTVHRVVQRLLHSPTVRVRQLAATPGGDQYAAVLRELFDLEVPAPDVPRAVAIEVEEDGGGAP